MHSRGLLFDRDGVLNRVIMRDQTVGSPRNLEEFALFAETGIILTSAAARGTVIVVTNQPDLDHGSLKQSELERMHYHLQNSAPGTISKILYEGSNDPTHPRRKPNPTMLLEATQEFSLDQTTSWMIGDSLKDLLAGERAGLQTVLIETGYNQAIHGRGSVNLNSHQELLLWLESLPVVKNISAV